MIATNDCSVQRTYLVKYTVNLIISDQQANFRGGNIRLEEIG